jgi:hypothetical protein
MKSAQPERSEVDIPFTVVDLDEPRVLLAQGLTDVDPVLVLADPAVTAHAADLVVAGYSSGGKGRDRAAGTGCRPRQGWHRRGHQIRPLTGTGVLVITCQDLAAKAPEISHTATLQADTLR